MRCRQHRITTRSILKKLSEESDQSGAGPAQAPVQGGTTGNVPVRSDTGSVSVQGDTGSAPMQGDAGGGGPEGKPASQRGRGRKLRTPFRRRRGDALADAPRSEEHTSELQSLMRISYAVFCLKKNNTNKTHTHLTSIYNAYTK